MSAMKLRMSKPGGSGAGVHWNALVAERCGFYRDAGLDVELVELDQNAGTATLRSGEIPVLRRGPDETIALIAQGEPFALVAALVIRPPLWLYSRAGVNEIVALRGGTIAGISERFGSSLNLRLLLADAGLAPGDVTVADVGGSNQRLAAVREGRADATLLSPTARQRADAAGLHALAALPARYPAFLFSAIQVNVPYARRERAAIVALMAAELRAQRWLADPANRAEAVALLAAADRVHTGDANGAYDDLVGGGVFPTDAALAGAPLDALVAALRRFGEVPATFAAETCIDESYLADARADVS